MISVAEFDCPCGGTLAKNHEGKFKCIRCKGEISVIKLNEIWLEHFKDKREVKKILSKVLY